MNPRLTAGLSEWEPQQSSAPAHHSAAICLQQHVINCIGLMLQLLCHICTSGHVVLEVNHELRTRRWWHRVCHAESCLRRQSSIIIIGVYRPPQARPHWFDTFNDLTLELLNKGKLIVMGDLNADIIHPLVQPAKALLDSLALAGTRFTTSEPTRVTRTTATCIDIIAVNEDIIVNRSEGSSYCLQRSLSCYHYHYLPQARQS